MSNGFDAYHKWLSIPPHDQPPNHYRLLGLGLFESDPDVVAAAADRQMAHVQTYKTGPHSELSQKLLNEISAAKLCLLRPQKKAAYDERLRQQLGAAEGRFGAFGTAPQVGSPPTASSAGNQPAATPPAVAPSIAAARMTNPAAFANVGPAANQTFPSPPGAVAGAAAPGMPAGTYLSQSNGPFAPPPPALPPPVADASRPLLISTVMILFAAGVMAVLLLIGIVVILKGRNDRAPSSTAIEKPHTAVSVPDSSHPSPASTPSTHPLSAQNTTSQGPATHGTSLPGQGGSFPPVATGENSPDPSGSGKNTRASGTASLGSPPKHSDSPAAADRGKKPPPTIPGEVTTTLPSGIRPPDKNRAEKTNSEKANPEKTNPGKTAPVTPPLDPAFAGKTAVPSPAAIAPVELRLGNMADSSAADLLEQAHKAAETIEIYVLLRRALDAAVKQGDAAAAISTVDELVRRFAVNALDVRLQTFNDLEAHVRTSASLAALADAAAGSIDTATAVGQSDSAQRLAEMSLTAARKSGNVELIRKITLRILRLRTAPVPASVPSP